MASSAQNAHGASASHTAEADTVAHLLADEATLERELAEARAAAQAVIEGARDEARRLREEGDRAIAEDVRARLASDEGGAAAEGIRAETAARVADLRRRAAAHRERALALLVDLVTGREPP
jgi:vacuolar-type H+-ATPase subunit H